MGAILEDLTKLFPNYPKLKEVENFVSEVIKEYDPLLIIMFGALPRGDYTYNSDVDALLIMNNQATWNEVYAFGGGVVQPISKTRDDFILQLKRGNPFFIQIMEEGIILHSKKGILDEFKSVASETISKMRMIRVERGWGIEDKKE